jgi:prolyl-tRNA synthetase
MSISSRPLITDKELAAFRREFLLRVEIGNSAEFASVHYHEFMAEEGYIRRASDGTWMLTPLGAARVAGDQIRMAKEMENREI